MVTKSVRTKTRANRGIIATASSALLAATLFATAPLSASATETYRHGPYSSAGACTADRDYAQNHHGSGWSYGGCYQLGPGAAGWYYNGYYSG